MSKKLPRLFRSHRPYRLFQLESSLMCSLDCVMCPWTDIRPPEAKMSRETFERIAAYFSLTEGIDLTGGGEPLTNSLIPQMVKTGKDAGCNVGFSTNGVRLNAEMARTLVALKTDWVSFSVDAAKKATYEHIRQGASFDLVMGNIAGLYAEKTRQHARTPQLMMVFVMMAENYHELPELVELAHNLGIEQVIAKNLDVILKEEDDQRRLFSHKGEAQPEVQAVLEAARLRAQSLGIGLRHYHLALHERAICEHNPLQSLFFNWQGEISPCITLSYATKRVFNGETVFAPCLRYGNVNEHSLPLIWDGAEYSEFRRQFAARYAAEQRATLQAFLSGEAEAAFEVPSAPVSCQSCYYLYGV